MTAYAGGQKRVSAFYNVRRILTESDDDASTVHVNLIR